MALGSQAYLGAFIKNAGSEIANLNRVYFVSASHESQFSVISCSAGGLIDGAPVTLEPNMGISIRLECKGKMLGLSKQLCVFDFGDFQIGRYVSAMVDDPHMSCIGPVAPYVPHERPRNLPTRPKYRDVIRGEKPFKCPAFLPIYLPLAQIPKQLWQAMEDDVDVLSIVPSLAEPLTPEIHQEKLSVLLHLEEIEMTRQMRQVSTRVMV